MLNRATPKEIENRKRVAMEIINSSNLIEESQSDIVGKIQKALGMPRHGASKLVLSLGVFEKRKSAPSIRSSDPNSLVCPKCFKELPKAEFPTKGKSRNGDARYSYCKKCHGAYQKVSKLKRQFNLSVEEYDKIGNTCFICGRPGNTIAISVDHDHKTGLIRGRLCMRCNRGLSWFVDSPALLEKAADYLRNPPASSILGKEVYGRVGKVNKKRRKKS